MIYICVRTYGNGKHMNKVHNLWFEWLSQADRVCAELNDIDAEASEKWIPMPLNEFVGCDQNKPASTIRYETKAGEE